MTVPITEEMIQRLRRDFIATIPPQPAFTAERGIVICGGGEKYLPSVWVLVNELYVLGNRLPIQLWHLGPAELPAKWAERMVAAGVECVDAYELRLRHPARILNGWEMKPYAMLHCPYHEVMLLDADNLPVRNPEFLFDTVPYKTTGAIFWPDLGRFAADHAIWRICGVAYRDEPEFESGQIVLNKERCWRELNLAMHLNEYSDFYYQHILGDKDTFHMAWRMLGTDYAMPPHSVTRLRGVLCQPDFEGDCLFQHRAGGPKWKIRGNTFISGFHNWERCVSHLAALTLPACAAPSKSPLRKEAEVVQRRMGCYARLLGNRGQSMSQALLLLAASPHRCLIELGVTQSFVPGGRAGCMSSDPAFWNPDRPEAWDWGAGFFTRVALEALQGMVFHYIGIDNNTNSHSIAAAAVAGLQGEIEFRLTDAEAFLTSWDGLADLIYFDHGESNEATALQHASDAAIIIQRGLLRGGGHVLLDDHHSPRGVAKTKYSLPLFLEAGFTVLLEGSQVLLEAPRDQRAAA